MKMVNLHVDFREDFVRLEVPVPASWLRAATGAPWQEEPGGLTLHAWDTDGLSPVHARRRLAARAAQAQAALAGWPGEPVPLSVNPGRVAIVPALVPSEDELPVMLDGLDLRILDKLATMADLAEAIDQFASAQPWSRTRSEGNTATCEGCPQCCAEPVPISSLDVAQLQLNGHIPNLGSEGDLGGCMVPVADGFCAFVDRSSGRCTVHPVRPWVCRTYFCCPDGPVYAAVREEVVGHILASTIDLGVDTPLRHTDDYRKLLLIDLLSEPVWRVAFRE